ncbi:MAG: AmmeMemoRadiSam system radical SAM enzyme [Clostridiaceae bacterium]|nr:AmmeMemoRadiSam system radical SAM enzyme [Clostridiaceae bacterium]
MNQVSDNGQNQTAERVQTAEGCSWIARYWQPTENKQVECLLCPHHCRINPGRTGLCLARKNENGRLLAESYGRVTSLSLDPIEKKPLRFFYPGSHILSVGLYGCNFRCGFCQNWSIAQRKAPYQMILPDKMADLAEQEKSRGNIGLAYTYNEPLVGFEYVLDCARLIHQKKMKNVLVTNGSINHDPLEELLPLIDAMNIDLKAWQPGFYQTVCRGELKPVLETIRRSAASCHIEITTLLIPGMNDQAGDIDALAAWLADIDPDIPLHLTRHHPDYQMPEPPPIDLRRMTLLAEVAGKHLKKVLLGNVPESYISSGMI